MSNLNSVFDILRGWPDSSALEAGFDPDTGATLPEGTLVYVATRELLPAKVLRIKDSSLVAAPALVAADRGKSYVVAGLGGAWAGFAIGDIVEWDGTAWNAVVAGIESEVATGTRVVVIEAAAAGAFAGHEEKVLQYTKKTVSVVSAALNYESPGTSDIGKTVVATGSGHTGKLVSYTTDGSRTWVIDPTTPADVFHVADTLAITGTTTVPIPFGTVTGATPAGATWAATVPISGNRIKINGVDSIYENKYYDYTGTHPGGAWYKSARQMEAPALIKALTSGVVASAPKDDAWMVIQGNDQYDSRFVNRVTCVKCSSGAVLKVATAIADTLVPGDRVCANAGALQKLTAGGGMEWPLGQVLLSNGIAGATGWVVIATY
jgi:hypothetical protein